MVQIPKLPPSEELSYKRQEILLEVYEQLKATKRIWFYTLAVIVVLAIPAGIVLQQFLTARFLTAYQPPAVFENPHNPEDLRVLQSHLLPVAEGVYSAAAQVVNPNPEITAWEVSYDFVFFDRLGQQIRRVPAKNFVMAGTSKFWVLPVVRLDQIPESVEVAFNNIKWTKRQPLVELSFEISGQNSGTNPEGQFFVEALVRNTQGFRLKQVPVTVLVFARGAGQLSGVNQTVLSDVLSQESRYFRVLWPSSLSNVGQIEVLPEVNPLEPGFALEEGEPTPPR